MRNIYYILRHGESEANVQGIIASSPKTAIEKYDLTEMGRKQVIQAFSKTPIGFSEKTILISSDFLRTRHTAETVGEILKIQTIEYNILLRERDFGELEGKHHSHYGRVWEKDKLTPDNKEWSIESPREVLARSIKLLDELEKKYEGEQIILVGHGDPLQILCAGTQKKCPSMHMLEKLNNAELRKLIFKN